MSLFRSRYGAYLTKEGVAELVSPHPDTLELMYTWLEHHNVPSSSISMAHGGSSLRLAGVPISQANHILGASYQLYNHVETNETILRTISYSLPAALHAHVQTVMPTTCFASLRAPWKAPRQHSSRAAADIEKAASGEPVMVLSNRDQTSEITPSFLSWIYNSWAYTPTATLWNDLGVVGFEGVYPSRTDLKAFMNKYARYGPDATFKAVPVNAGGYYEPWNANLEANLDIQYTEAIAYPTPHIFYGVDQGLWGKDDPYLLWLKYILDQPSIPPTISISYGTEEKYYPLIDAVYVCLLFAQLAARGVSVLFASGDYGVGNGDCGTQNGPNNVRFDTLFPSSCTCSDFSWIKRVAQIQTQVTHHAGFAGPAVTSVGGTTGRDPEVAASLSGGGFSNYFDRPPYQMRAVSKYLQQFGNAYQGLYK